jgi:predicted nucleic acid-binding Zn finger protein
MNEIWDRLIEKPELNEEIRVKIVAAFGRKGSSALGAIDAGRVKKYLDFFVVEGKTASYIVEEDFCTCGDFLYRGRNCWHLLAVRIALETSTYQSVNSWYHETMKEKPAK